MKGGNGNTDSISIHNFRMKDARVHHLKLAIVCTVLPLIPCSVNMTKNKITRSKNRQYLT